MSGFSPDWLRLREPLDAAARDASVSALLSRHRATPLSVIDLGAGSGANLRYLAPLLGGLQEWLLVDDDLPVLQAVAAELRRWATSTALRLSQTADVLVVTGGDLECRVRRRRVDLAADMDTLHFPDRALVTSSALLDLVSAAWLRSLAERCRAARADVLFALTYDGRMTCEPVESSDENVRELFNRHQAGDKGFGPALGPAAATKAAQMFRELGYEVEARPSDWRIGPDDRALQAALIDGWLAAALETAPEEEAALRSWHRRRCKHVERGDSVLRVGHVDLVGWLPPSANDRDD